LRFPANFSKFSGPGFLSIINLSISAALFLEYVLSFTISIVLPPAFCSSVYLVFGFFEIPVFK